MKVYGVSPQVVKSTKILRSCEEPSKTIYVPKDNGFSIINLQTPQAYLNAQLINFGYKSILKTYWIKGKMPQVQFDMGGNLLTKANVSLGHMLPHSKGGHTSLANLMLETKKYNMSKGNAPFSKFFDQEMFDKYCAQFEEIDLPEFNGKNYVEKITKTAKRLIREGK